MSCMMLGFLVVGVRQSKSSCLQMQVQMSMQTHMLEPPLVEI